LGLEPANAQDGRYFGRRNGGAVRGAAGFDEVQFPYPHPIGTIHYVDTFLSASPGTAQR
jgi:hypothetical protein